MPFSKSFNKLLSKGTLKLLPKLYSTVALSLMVLSVLTLQSCTLMSESTSSNGKSGPDESKDIKAIGKNIIELGDIPKDTLKTDSALPSNDPNNTQIANSTTESKTQYQIFIAQQASLKSELPENIHTLYKLALAEMKNKNWQGARELLDDVIKQYPRLSVAYLNKALALYQLKQLDGAVMSLQQAEKVNPINPYIYNLQGVIAREQGQFNEAEKRYKQALALWPDYAEAHLNIAVFFELYRGEFVQAKAHYQAYLALKPDDARAKKWLAGLEVKLATRQES
ncbi:tetratricopeptide repeat protein [Colwellia sp. RE-S-Sl-9]